jgi:hypothetical protein
MQRIFNVLYAERDHIAGVNYWTLTDSSTAVVDRAGNLKQVADVIKNYYKPGAVYGTVRNTAGDVLENVVIADAHSSQLQLSLGDGSYSVMYPAGEVTFTFRGEGYISSEMSFYLDRSTKIQKDVVLEPTQKDLLYRFREFLYHFFG